MLFSNSAKRRFVAKGIGMISLDTSRLNVKQTRTRFASSRWMWKERIRGTRSRYTMCRGIFAGNRARVREEAKDSIVDELLNHGMAQTCKKNQWLCCLKGSQDASKPHPRAGQNRDGVSEICYTFVFSSKRRSLGRYQWSWLRIELTPTTSLQVSVTGRNLGKAKETRITKSMNCACNSHAPLLKSNFGSTL